MMLSAEKSFMLRQVKQKSLRGYCLLFVLCSLVMHSTVSYGGREGIKHGAVMARTLILDDEGRPILVEYNEKGEEGANVSDKLSSEQKANMDQLVIMSIDEYKMEKLRYDNFMLSRANDLALDAELMSKEEYEQAEFKAADGKTAISKPTLKPFAKGVLVRGQSNRLVPLNHTGPWEPLVLLSFGVDLSQKKEPGIAKGTLLVDAKGQIIHETENNIAPRVGFFGDPEEKQEFYSGIRKNDDEIFGPIKDVKVYIAPEVFLGSLTTTDYRGKYTMRFLMPYCPGGFEFTTDLWAELMYANFSPFGSPAIPYYLRRQDWTYCYEPFPFAGGNLIGAMAYVNALAISATMAIPLYNADFKVDVMFLSGKVFLKNPDGTEITVGTTTEYNLDTPETTKTAQAYYDFDGDGKQDRSELGIIENQVQEDGTIKKVFKKTAGGEYQAVWFSSHVKPDGSPDVIRIADVKKKLKPNGLLKSISKEDFKNTDILVFRESTGQLVLERRGLRDKEVAGRVDHGLGKDDKYFYYRLMMRGPMDHHLNIGAINRRGNWNDWATEYQLAKPFREREADHLKSGEWIRLVIINRATGYMATQRILLGDASINKNNMLNVKLEDTYLMPPNLKIWAERNYKHEYGLDKGKEEHNSVIGMEGASTADDERITVFTEWYDEEGRPLPEGLGADNGEQFGLTARLARIVSENKIGKASDAGNLAEFAIRPGSHMEVLRQKDNMTGADHFYVHVIGTQKDEEHSFETLGIQEVLDTRPKNATPFLVPFNDETEDWKSWSAWNQLKRAYDAEQLAEEPIKPRGHYSWYHRPEYQFSQISLEVDSIIRSYTDESGKTSEQELLVEQEGEGKVPTIRGDDDLITVFYSLIANNYNRLSPLEGEQEFIFGLGANEIKATVGKNGEIRFDNLEHIDYLDPTDLLSIRLYVNHDAANTLWEWAFTRNGLHVYYEVPGNTQAKSKRSLPTITDVNCNNTTCTDIEILALLAKEEPTPPVAIPVQPDPKVRTLGGMRLRLRYIPPSLEGLKVEKVTWKIGHRGRYCNRYGVDSVACVIKEANDTYEQKQPTGPIIVVNETGDWSVYWEPVKGGTEEETDWSNWAGTQTDDHGVDSELKAEYTIPIPGNNINDNPIAARVSRYFEQKFTFNTRELKPATGTEKPMEGSDVAMLEAILWQFGISPQYGFPGYAGTRLGEYSASLGGVVGGDTRRDIFSKGSGGAKGAGSLEKMMIRFNSRLFETTEDALKNATSTKGAVLDMASLGEMGKLWKDYYRAVRQYAEGFFTQDSLADENWSVFASAMMGNVAFKSPDKTDTLDISYDDSIHQLAMTAIGGTANRIQLLKAWASKENDRHWGVGKSAYRISEGGADEVGSIGFSQIWFSYIYGKASRCSKIKNVNMYHPQNNLLGFAVWVGAKGCGGSFYKAFNTTDYDIAADTVTADKLRGYICADTQGQASVCNYQVDHYERLMKGLIGYNAGASADRLLKCSLAEMLAGGVTRGGVNCQSTRSQGKGFDYGLTILHGKMPGDVGGVDSRFLTLPHRTFVWVGERYPANLKLDDGVTSDPRAGTPKWCFKYGEKEWRELVSWDDAKRRARGDALALPPIQPIGRTNCD